MQFLEDPCIGRTRGNAYLVADGLMWSHCVAHRRENSPDPRLRVERSLAHIGVPNIVVRVAETYTWAISVTKS